MVVSAEIVEVDWLPPPITTALLVSDAALVTHVVHPTVPVVVIVPPLRGELNVMLVTVPVPPPTVTHPVPSPLITCPEVHPESVRPLVESDMVTDSELTEVPEDPAAVVSHWQIPPLPEPVERPQLNWLLIPATFVPKAARRSEDHGVISAREDFQMIVIGDGCASSTYADFFTLRPAAW